MPSPFPGMDPYLEDPEIWSGFHHAFLSRMHEQLAPQLRLKYFVRVEERVYVTNEADPGNRYLVPDIRIIHPERLNRAQATPNVSKGSVAELIPVAEMPDPEIHEHRLEILDRVDRSVVTVIELLSPTNKVGGAVGRGSFLQKRKEIFESPAHWMELDLLRAGTRTANFRETVDAEYQLYLSRAGSPRKGYVLPIFITEQLPTIGVPLKHGDPDAPLNLQAALDEVYELCSYDMDFDYVSEPAHPLSSALADWARAVIAKNRRSDE